MDLLKDMGALAFASRMKRLSDRLMDDVRTLYRRVDIDFNPRWFTTLYTLSNYGSLSVSDLSQMIGLTHTAVHLLAEEMGREGLLVSAGTSRDRRKRILALTEEGMSLAARLSPVWKAIESATAALIEESGVDVLQSLSEIEGSLDEEDMFRRAWFRLKNRPGLDIRIEQYRPAYKKYFASLNRQWIEDYFKIEAYDEKVLSDPRAHILKKGGTILFALLDDEVVGTCALLRHGEHRELSKMAVEPRMRGLGVGSRLLQAVFDLAADEGVPEIYLQTSSTLKAAVRLYKHHGFSVIETLPFAPPGYSRESICMVCRVTDFLS
ncbi:MarR family transcriptional regulator [bacterium]|nr:MarR family transcriptional regulator [bacterium]